MFELSELSAPTALFAPVDFADSTGLADLTDSAGSSAFLLPLPDVDFPVLSAKLGLPPPVSKAETPPPVLFSDR